jgi:hypothetical protein
VFSGQPSHRIPQTNQALRGVDRNRVGVAQCRPQLHRLANRPNPQLHVGGPAERIVHTKAVRPDRVDQGDWPGLVQAGLIRGSRHRHLQYVDHLTGCPLQPSVLMVSIDYNH